MSGAKEEAGVGVVGVGTGQEGRVQRQGTDASFELNLIPNLPQGLGQPVLLHMAQSATKRCLPMMQPVLGTSMAKSSLPAIDVLWNPIP